MTIKPSQPTPLTGDEPFKGLNAGVLDFWRFAMSDLRTNNVRGHLAEFLVARALGVTAPRIEWDPWDVQTPDGDKIEVKASGYLQAWAQNKLSAPSFRAAPAYGWNADTGEWTLERQYNADVYVFCLHTATSHEEYDPLDTAQWQFYVLGRTAIAARKYKSMGLATLSRLAGEAVPYPGLRVAVEAAARVEREPSP